MNPPQPKASRRSAGLFSNLLFLAVALGASAWIIGVYMEVTAAPDIYTQPDSIPAVQAVIVPGASVHRSGRLSPVLAQRMEAAMALARARTGVKLLLSGTDIPQGYSETKAMRDYAKEHGFPVQDVLLDPDGRSTFVTMVHCKEVFGFDRVAFVSQRYHLPRALYIAHRLGITAYGLAVEPGESEWHGREWASRFKDFFLARIYRFFYAH